MFCRDVHLVLMGWFNHNESLTHLLNRKRGNLSNPGQGKGGRRSRKVGQGSGDEVRQRWESDEAP